MQHNEKQKRNPVDLKEINEERYYKIGLVILFGFMLLFAFFLVFLFSSKKSENKMVKQKFETTLDSNFVAIQEDIINKDSISIYLKKKELHSIKALNEVKKRQIAQVFSTKPTGFYIMIGIFSEYENASNLKQKNMTIYDCHIFEPDKNALHRVALFITDNDFKKAIKNLKLLRTSYKDCWIFYNVEKD